MPLSVSTAIWTMSHRRLSECSDQYCVLASDGKVKRFLQVLWDVAPLTATIKHHPSIDKTFTIPWLGDICSCCLQKHTRFGVDKHAGSWSLKWWYTLAECTSSLVTVLLPWGIDWLSLLRFSQIEAWCLRPHMLHTLPFSHWLARWPVPSKQWFQIMKVIYSG